MIVTITCLTCEQPFEYDAQGGKRAQRCPPCRLERKHETDALKAKRWRDADPVRAKRAHDKLNNRRSQDPAFRQRKRDNELRRSYGLTRDALNELIAGQNGQCAICGGGPNGPGDRLHVDHCHDSNRVRGLLCAKCNTAVGLLDDDPDRAEAVAKYLRSFLAPR